MSDPLPFDDVSPDYLDFYRDTRDGTRINIIRPYTIKSMDFERGQRLTIADICSLIENKRILEAKMIGKHTVKQYLDLLYKHRYISKQWYEKQLSQYV